MRRCQGQSVHAALPGPAGSLVSGPAARDRTVVNLCCRLSWPFHLWILALLEADITGTSTKEYITTYHSPWHIGSTQWTELQIQFSGQGSQCLGLVVGTVTVLATVVTEQDIVANLPRDSVLLWRVGCVLVPSERCVTGYTSLHNLVPPGSNKPIHGEGTSFMKGPHFRAYSSTHRMWKKETLFKKKKTSTLMQKKNLVRTGSCCGSFRFSDNRLESKNWGSISPFLSGSAVERKQIFLL